MILARSVPERVGAENDWRTVRGGFGNALAVKTDGSLWGWGDASFGRLGMLGATGNTVTGTNQVQSMSDTSAFYPASGQLVFGPGFPTTASVAAVGTGVMTMGSNAQRTMTGMPLYTTIRPVPQRIDTDSDWKVGIPAMNASLGLKADGTLWGWGAISSGLLGVPHSVMVDSAGTAW
jgi:alpha-tubulin suppressor-like RCC1 family protein